MMDICPKNKCTACYACVNACMHGCISMQEDDLGCIHPVVDETNCVHCKLCSKSCPNNTELIFSYPSRCYASWIKDNDKRKICASGGIGTIMSEYVIKQGGVVFGSRYDADLTPIMTYAESLEEIEFFKGSRYVQSLVGDTTFKKVKEFLHRDRLVLFIGTPCQIAGLKCYLRKDYEKLVTVDLICHGVCPTSYLKNEVAYLVDKYKLTGVSDIRFRGNDGNNYRLTLWNKARRKLFPRDNYRQKLLRFDEAQQFYIKGFLLGVSMRENCYSCNYSRPERISDITIGDFIGLGKTVPFIYPKHNVSSVLINTRQGTAFYHCVSESMDVLVNIERDYLERLEYKPSLVYAFPRHPLNAKFVELYKQNGYLFAIHKTLRPILRKELLRSYLNYWTYIYRVPRKVIKIILRKNGKK